MVALIEERITEEGLAQVVADLTADAPANMKFIRKVRDGDLDDVNSKTLGVRLRAAMYLGDKAVPNAGKDGRTDDHSVNIVLGAGLLGQMARALRQDGAVLDAEVVKTVDVAAPNVPLTPDEFIERYIADDARKELEATRADLDDDDA